MGPPVIAALEALLIASRSPFQPSQASDPSGSNANSTAHRFLAALEASLSPTELAQEEPAEFVVKFDALGVVGKWFVDLIAKWRAEHPAHEADSDGGYGTRSKGKPPNQSAATPAEEEVAQAADAALERVWAFARHSPPRSHR